MTTFKPRRLPTFLTNSRVLPLVAVFLVVLGSRLWLIESYGNDVPFEDQWDAEAAQLYKPMLEHGYGAINWFAAHNEHRIVLTRMTAVVMLVINGQWDPLLQVAWEAVCAAMIATLLCLSAVRLMPDNRAIGLIFGVVLIGLTMPYGWENTLQGFQNQFYYLMLLAVAILHLCAYRGSLTARRALLIGALGVLALGTIASGAIACLAAACALVARLAFGRQADTPRVIGLAVALAAMTLIGVGTIPEVAGHEALRAQSILQFLKVLNIVLGWPSKLGCLIWLPFCAWGLQSISRRKLGAPGVFVVGLAAFVMLNAAATAAARGGDISAAADLASRYSDIAWCGWLVNLLAVLLMTENDHDERLRVGRPVAMLFFVVASISLCHAGWAGLAGAAQRGASYKSMSANVRNYLATGDSAALRDIGPGETPYPDADRLMQFLDDPTIRGLLPPGVRLGVLARSGAAREQLADHGLLFSTVPPGGPPPAPEFGDWYGTWSQDQSEHTAKFISAPIRAEGSTLRTLVSGYLGRPGMSFYAEDVASGQRVGLIPSRLAESNWELVSATVPGPLFRLVAEDTATEDDGWFAFTDPVESGRLRRLTAFLIRNGKEMLLIGLSLFLASVLVGSLALQRGEHPDT